MSDVRADHLTKMQEIRVALRKTKSPFLKRDYRKALKRLGKELKMYDALQGQQAR